MKVEFSKVSNNETVYKKDYFDSITQTIFNENELMKRYKHLNKMY